MLTTKRLLVTYCTGTGNTKRMAEEIGRGAERLGVKVEAKRVEECGLNDLAEADGIVIGSPTYFSNVAWEVKMLIDESIALYRKRHQLRDKVAAPARILRDTQGWQRLHQNVGIGFRLPS